MFQKEKRHLNWWVKLTAKLYGINKGLCKIMVRHQLWKCILAYFEYKINSFSVYNNIHLEFRILIQIYSRKFWNIISLLALLVFVRLKHCNCDAYENTFCQSIVFALINLHIFNNVILPTTTFLFRYPMILSKCYKV